METLDPQLAAAFVATTGVGFLMMFAGVHKSMLETRLEVSERILARLHQRGL